MYDVIPSRNPSRGGFIHRLLDGLEALDFGRKGYGHQTTCRRSGQGSLTVLQEPYWAYPDLPFIGVSVKI